MTLSAGDRLGPYEVQAPLGAGGMGEVYRARDRRLGREVAIKVLRTEALNSPESRRRFEVEARAASGLNHPNILTVYDIGDEGGVPYLVSELLQGEPLTALLKKGPLAVRRLIDLALQITDGLAAAHAAGITHRDLKPDNLFVLTGGRVKILDFGLAKAALPAAQEDETRTLSDLLTSPGVIVGTIAYMSPEQCKGLPVDFRSDQFSLGTVLYEMATGKRPFQRADRVSTMSAIVSEDTAPVTNLNPQVPAPLAWIIERCLAKEPERRYASTVDLHLQIREARDHLSELSAHKPGVPPARGRKRLPVLLALTGIVAGFLAAVFILPPAFENPRYRYTPFSTEAIDEAQPAWSPDGQSIAYIAAAGGLGQVFTRTITSSVPAQITHSDSACSDPFWSPDGTRIYYRAGGSLWSVGAVGGAPQVVVQKVASMHAPASVSPDGNTLAYIRPEGSLFALYLLSLSSGAARAYQTAPFPASFRFSDAIRFSPDGKGMLAAVVPAIGLERRVELWILPYPGGTPRRIPLKAPVRTGPRGVSVDWASDNRHCLVSAELTPGTGGHIYVVDTQTGEIQPVTAGTGEESEPAVSPEGRRIAFASGTGEYDLVEVSLDGGISPLLATSRQEHSASWSPSGRQFVYVSNAGGMPDLWLRNAGENSARRIAQGAADGDLDRAQPRFSPDGQRLAYTKMAGRHTVWISNMSGGRDVPLEQQSEDQHAPAWSPDGNWIVYARFNAGKWEIAKAPSGGGGAPVRICDGGTSGSWIDWSSSGNWIAYQDSGGIHVVAADGGAPRLSHGPAAAFAFSKDGAGMYVVSESSDGAWELASYTVPDGLRKTSVALKVPPGAAITDISLHPDGKRFAASLRTLRRDIWILDGFGQPGWLGRWWSR